MCTMILTILILLLCNTYSGGISVGFISNALLVIPDSQSVSVSGNCSECICRMASNVTYFALNCLPINRTCELFLLQDQTKQFSMVSNSQSLFYFLSLPNYTSTTSNMEQSEIIWDFNHTLNDRLGMNVGVLVGNLLYSNSSITGDRSSASFETYNQYVVVSTPNIQLNNRSWTFEGWIFYQNIYQNNQQYDFGIVGNCDSEQNNQCLQFNIRSGSLYFRFNSQSLYGSRTLSSNNWYHFAVVMNCETKQSSIYLDGVLDQQMNSNSCYQGRTTNITIGTSIIGSSIMMFNGLIDQISFTNRSKSTQEILNDATLVAYFPFDNNTITDQGPLRLNSRSFGSISLSTQGHRSGALLINNQDPSYLLIENLVRLGNSAYDYSFALWIKPNVIRQSTLIYVSSKSDGSQGSCVAFLGLDRDGYLSSYLWTANQILQLQITANIWTHIALTYSAVNGPRLYMNGLWFHSIPSTYSAIGSSNYVFVGSLNAGGSCYGSNLISGQYDGFIDELRIYSRELDASEVISLAA